MPIRFSPVWFTSDQQVEGLVSSYKNASWFAKLAGRLEIAEGMPYIRGVLTPWMRMPIVFSAEGELTIDDQEITFRSRPFRLFGWKAEGMPEDFSFRIQSDEIISIEPADLQSPVVSFFDLPFTRIRAKCPAPLDSFLICVGGRIAMPSIKARSRELREQLMRWSTASADSSH